MKKSEANLENVSDRIDRLIELGTKHDGDIRQLVGFGTKHDGQIQELIQLGTKHDSQIHHLSKKIDDLAEAVKIGFDGNDQRFSRMDERFEYLETKMDAGFAEIKRDFRRFETKTHDRLTTLERKAA